MDIQYKGANCVVLSTKKATLVVDDNLEKVGLKTASNKADVQLFTGESSKGTINKEAFVIDGPGEYEVKGVSVTGIPARAHTDEEGKQTATIYTITANGIRVCFTDHIFPELSDAQLEKMGVIDLLVIPVGGNGFTLDSVGAAKIAKKIEPKTILPTHYADKAVKYEVPQNGLEDFLKEIGSEGEAVDGDKLKLKAGIFPENLAVYKLNRS